MAPMLNKSSNLNPVMKKIVPTSGLNSSTNLNAKGKDQRSQPAQLGSSQSTTTVQGIPKVGPSTFRTGSTVFASQEVTHTSTITLVSANPQAERRPLGPPSRPSAMAQSQILTYGNNGSQALGIAGPSNILQQSRVTLQSQLEQKAVDMQSEDIVLPDIASE